jgi:hypothetical protein
VTFQKKKSNNNLLCLQQQKFGPPARSIGGFLFSKNKKTGLISKKS